MSAANYVEAAIVIDAAKSPIASRRFDDTVAAAGIIVEPVDREQAEIARGAYSDFGKASGHPAGLIFGDCFAYALARVASRCCLRATISRRPTSPSPDDAPSPLTGSRASDYDAFNIEARFETSAIAKLRRPRRGKVGDCGGLLLSKPPS